MLNGMLEEPRKKLKEKHNWEPSLNKKGTHG
jgi:hypothetical protein